MDADADAVGAKNTQDDRFAVIGGQGADAEVHVDLVDDHLDAAVLGEAFFGDVDAGHDFEAADERAFHAQGDAVALDAFAVDAVADADAVLHRLDVNIAGAIADGFADHGAARA